MRILHVIQELATGGAERIAVSLARGAEAAGHQTAFVAADGALAHSAPGPVFALPHLKRSLRQAPAAARALDRAIRAWRPTLVHAHNPGMALISALATLRGARVSALASVQGLPPEDYRRASVALRIAGLPLVSCGTEVAARLSANGCRVSAVIENAVAPAAAVRAPAQVRAEFGLDAGQRLIVAVGRLVAQKNHHLAISALADVPRARLVIVGDGPLRSELDDAAETHGVRDRVVFAGLRPDAPDIVAAADVLVMPSRWEGLPLAVLEAMAAWTPVVATSVIGLRELLRHGESGLLVPPDDRRALSQALRRLLDDPALARRLAAGAATEVERRTLERMISEYLAVYESVARTP